MAISGGDQVASAFAAGAVVAVLAGATAKAATMRSDTHNKWLRRVQYSDAALERREIAELKALRRHLDEVMPAGDDPIALSTFDPAPLAKLTSEVAALHSARDRMTKAFAMLKRLGDAFTILLPMLMIAVIMLSLHYIEIVISKPWLRTPGLIIGATALVCLTVTGVMLLVVHRRLSTAQEKSGWGDPPEGAA